MKFAGLFSLSLSVLYVREFISSLRTCVSRFVLGVGVGDGIHGVGDRMGNQRM